MKKITAIMILVFLSIFSTYACSCECIDDCSFGVTSESRELVALVKVVSYDDFLERKIMGHEGKMPYSMTLEIIKKYKGSEVRKTIKIWGDNGNQCRPYIANFKIGGYYLIAPSLLGDSKLTGESSTDYEFVICSTDYLKVDMDKKIAYGQYAKGIYKVALVDFEEGMKK